MAQGDDDRTLSPYFSVKTATEGSDVLPLKHTSVQADVAGVIADVRVTQVYTNTGGQPLEATYVFPGSTRAAVYGMKMTIGERVQIAQIKEKQAAIKTYTEAKAAGKSATLLEQHRPNVFQMSIANIMPGDEIRVELSYTELLVPTEGIYSFVYPTVVGPRYSSQPAAAAPESERWVANPYLREGELPPHTFALTMDVSAGMPIQEITSTSHPVNIRYGSPSEAQIALKPTETFGANRDFILNYRLQGSQVNSGLLLYEGEQENFFLLMMQPPKRIVPEQIPARDYVFVLDVSGSMHGFPLETTKQLMKNLLGNLRPQDTFNILLFAGTSSLFAEQSVSATPANIQRAVSLLDFQRGGGGTELLPALQRALNLSLDEKTSRSIVIATDGYVTVETAAFDLIRQNLNRANVFAFGIGSSVNRFLIEGLARAGQGEPFIVTKPTEAAAIAETFRTYISTPVLTGVTIIPDKFSTYDVEPLSIPDVLAERPVVMFGKWHGSPKGTITLKGWQGEQAVTQTLNVSHVKPTPNHAALRYLWARHRIATIGDYQAIQGNDDLVNEMTQLGLQYNLLTQYTSFVAVDDVVRNTTGNTKKVKQPLPLPQGVSNHAVGSSVPITPEPETWALLGITGLILLTLGIRQRDALLDAIQRIRVGK